MPVLRWIGGVKEEDAHAQASICRRADWSARERASEESDAGADEKKEKHRSRPARPLAREGENRPAPSCMI